MTIESAAPARKFQTSGEAVIQAAEVTRTYGEGEAAVHALRGVSLEIERHRLTAVMGPSGSGKSTLMHILAGLDRPDSGTVSIDGTEITALDDDALTKLRRSHIGFIFQFFNLLPMLTAEENILLPLEIAGSRPDAGWHEEVMQKVGLTERRTHRPAELSGGQQQRVAVARAVVAKPVVMFADEPTGNLDSRTGAEILGLLRDTVDSLGQTTVMVTHDPQAAAIADRVLFLDDGHVVRDQTALYGARDPGDDGRAGGAMRRVALKGLAFRKVRALLTALAVVLGVAMVSGTYVLTDSIQRAFDGIFTGSYQDTSAVISGKQVVEFSTTGKATVPESLLQTVRGVEGVQQAEGAIFDLQSEGNTVKLYNDKGEAAGNGQAPSFGFGFDGDADRFNPLRLVDGQWAAGPSQVVIDQGTAEDQGWAIGDRIRAAAEGPAKEFTVSGIARLGDVQSLGGATLAVFDLSTAQQLLNKEGQLDTIFLASERGGHARAADRGHRAAAARERAGAHRRSAGQRGFRRASARASTSSATSCSPSRRSRSPSAPS